MTQKSGSAPPAARKGGRKAHATEATEGSPADSRAAGRTLAQLADIPVDRVHRIGTKRSESLRSLGIESVVDLVMYYPRRYIDRTRQSEVAGMQVGQES